MQEPPYTYRQMRHTFHTTEPLVLESGETLKELTIAYDTFGRLNADRSNVVWVMHALTANSDVADWWPGTVEKGKFLDPERYFIVCANVLGSCYGTTGPMSVNPDTGEPWYGDFPLVTVRDMVECHRRLASHLGIERIELMVGSSLGGFQATEWLVTDPGIARNAVLIATDVECSPWLAAFNKSMYMAIEADPTSADRNPEAGRAGLATARSLALLSYRGCHAYNRTQRDPEGERPLFDRRVHSYQAYQGKKLCDRFDVNSYLRMCRSADSHNIARGRVSLQEALGRIKAHCLVVAISSDILFPPADHSRWAAMIPDASMEVIDSDFAHDGFLIENEKLNKIISDWQSRSRS